MGSSHILNAVDMRTSMLSCVMGCQYWLGLGWIIFAFMCNDVGCWMRNGWQVRVIDYKDPDCAFLCERDPPDLIWRDF